jgi:predicted AAA+ superfamily ATPase
MINRPLYIKQIQPLIDKDVVKVLTGFRRSGKSVLLDLIKKYLVEHGRNATQLLTINFEDFAYYEYRSARAMHDYLQEKIQKVSGKVYLFLDEIQEVTGFEQVINSLRVSEDVDIYLTGSNANLLSSELSTYLAGRYVQIARQTHESFLCPNPKTFNFF